jgi:hypothetical protein
MGLKIYTYTPTQEKRKQEKQARIQKLQQDIVVGSAPRALSRFYK